MNNDPDTVLLPAALRAQGVDLIELGEVTSTMDEAARIARTPDVDALWIVARRQTAGRGRHGRIWSSPPGNLYATLLLRRVIETAQAPQLGFVAGLALHDAVADLTGLAPPRLALKWPNDLLLEGAKCAGLLLEGLSIEQGRSTVAIGFGVNVAQAPQDTPYPAVTLTSVADRSTRADTFSRLSVAFAARMAQYTTDGFGPIREAWMLRARGVSEPLRVVSGARVVEGVFREIDVTGRLILMTPDGPASLAAGDVFFPTSAAHSAARGSTDNGTFAHD